jgi:hypothetical protein
MNTAMKPLVALAALGAVTIGSAMIAPPASAMTADKLANVETTNVDQVRWVCGYYRGCWWRPGPVWYGPRFYSSYGHRRYGGWYGSYGRSNRW